MSFRKRSEIIGNPAPGRGAPPTPLAPPVRQPARPQTRLGSGPLLRPLGRPGAAPRASSADALEAVMKNPGIRPSLCTSQPTVSTGASDLDKILLHQGLPTGTTLLVEESGTTDFALVLLRAFAAQGVVHNRLDKDTLHCHVIAVGVAAPWAKELPGIYKGSSKDQKKAKILQNESKVSVANMSLDSSSSRDMKIAWRYGLGKKNEPEQEDVSSTVYENYNHQFDITLKLVPGAGATEMSFLPLSTHAQLLAQIKSIITNQLRNNPAKTVRIVIPNLLNPSLYGPTYASPTWIYPFVHGLRALVHSYPQNVAAMASIALDLFPRESNLTLTIENLMDAAVHLSPFNQDMMAMIEKAYKNEPAKIQQGLVHIVKIPILSDRGLMMIFDGEYAFKNGRKKFEIEPWGIPVEDDGKEEQTTKNIDF